MSGRQRIDGQVAYILHSHAYSETSLILDVFTRDYGRLAFCGHGARRPRFLRGILQALTASWVGSARVKFAPLPKRNGLVVCPCSVARP